MTDFAPRIRFAEERDRNAILKPWLTSYINEESGIAKGVDRRLAFDEHDRLVQSILLRKETITLLACDPEADWHILSWVCGELRPGVLVLHYGGTYRDFRGVGLFRMLLDKLLAERGDRELVFTHRNRKSKILGPAIGATYNPYRIFQ